jgi:hypothetical protein
VFEARHEELADTNRCALDGRAADEERLRAGAAEQAGRFKIQKQQAGLKTRLDDALRRGPGTRHHTQGIGALGDRRNDVADRHSAVPHVRGVFTVDDDHLAVGSFDESATELQRRTRVRL